MSENPAAVEVAEGIWLIKLPLPFPVAAINVYLVRSVDGFLLLDCGLKSKACRQALAGALSFLGIGWSDIRQVVISHAHPDHFGLAAEVRRLSGGQVLMHPAEAALISPRYLDHEFFSKNPAWLAENGVPPDESADIVQASAGIAEFIEMVEVDRTLGDGDRLPVEGGDLEVLWSPGHSPGLLTFYLAGRRLYFSSDHIVERITPNIGLHSGSSENPLSDYLASLDRVRAKDIDLVLPSHGHPFAGHREWIGATEQHHRERCQRMAGAVAEAPLTAYEIVGIEWGNNLSPLNERFAVAETLAHLEYLRRQGRVERQRGENGLIRWRKIT